MGQNPGPELEDRLKMPCTMTTDVTENLLLLLNLEDTVI